MRISINDIREDDYVRLHPFSKSKGLSGGYVRKVIPETKELFISKGTVSCTVPLRDVSRHLYLQDSTNVQLISLKRFASAKGYTYLGSYFVSNKLLNGDERLGRDARPFYSFSNMVKFHNESDHELKVVDKVSLTYSKRGRKLVSTKDYVKIVNNGYRYLVKRQEMFDDNVCI